MKRKKLLVALLASGALTIYTSAVAYASVHVYTNWAGTESYVGATSNLDKIGNILSGNRDTIASQEDTISEQESALTAKDSDLVSLELQLGELQAELGLLGGILDGVGGLFGRSSMNYDEVVPVVEQTLVTLDEVETNLESAKNEVANLNENLELEKQAKEQIGTELSGREAELQQAEKDMGEILNQSSRLLEEYGSEENLP